MAVRDQLSAQEAHDIAVDAYIYVYPLITMDITRKQMTNLEAGKEIGKGPMNGFSHVPAYPPADTKVVVRPNFDRSSLSKDLARICPRMRSIR